MKKVNLIGKRFGRLVVVGEAHGRYVECACDCGNKKVIYKTNLTGGKSKSCGCLRNELVSARRRTHGLSQTPEYASWIGMVRRCTDEKYKQFKDYGGRGITVCDEWKNIDAFLLDMGPRPEGMTLERKDNDKGYSPSNCVWASRAAQQQNKRDNKLDPFKACNIRYLRSIGMKITDICKRYGVSERNISKICNNHLWKGFKYSDKPAVKTPSIFKSRVFA